MKTSFIKKALTNKVSIYLVTRYVVYGVTFLTTFIKAGRLGPYYLGIWGSVLLLLKYFHVIDFGIGNSMSVLLVQNKNDKQKSDDYEKAALFLLGIIALAVVGIALYYGVFGIPFLQKFELGKRFYYVCLIAIFQYFGDYALKVYRVKGKMFEFTFYQTFVHVIILPVLFLARGERLVDILIWTYVFSYILTAAIFAFRGGISYEGKLHLGNVKDILGKGIFLFIYNSCFYFIVLSTKTIISTRYSVEEFGFFTFAYTLANGTLAFLTAFSSLITPKLLDKFHTDDPDKIDKTVHLLRSNYVTMAHGIMYLALPVFPLLLLLLPKYATALPVINLTALAVLLYANSFGYVSFLMAKNWEKRLALNTVIALVLNVSLALVLVNVLHVGYQYVILATLVTYFVYACLVVEAGKRCMGLRPSLWAVIAEVMPIGLLVPYLTACVLTVVGIPYLMVIPFLLFVAMNIPSIKEIIRSVKRITYHPDVIDIKKDETPETKSNG